MTAETNMTTQIPKIGDRAPDFQANSSKGPISLKDYWKMVLTMRAK